VDILVVIPGVLDSEYGQELGGCKADGIPDFSYAIPDVLEEFVEGKILVEIGRGREAVLCGGEYGGLSLNGLTVDFAAEDNYLLPAFCPAMARRSEEPKGIQVLLDGDEVLGFDDGGGISNINREFRECLTGSHRYSE
jgi:hypothetical protein